MYKNNSPHAEDTAEGAVLAPGERTGSSFDPDHPHNKRLINEGVFVSLDDQEPDATNSAKKFASENHIELRAVTGTGAGGRITMEDVERHIAEASGKETA